MRLEIHGCRAARCDVALGAEDYRLPDVSFSASSRLSYTYSPHKARLNLRSYSWIAKYRNRKQWLQVDVGNKARIIKLATQGNYRSMYWVRSFALQFGFTMDYLRNYKEGRHVKIFQANYDRSTIVYHTLRPISARYVRFRPTSWQGYISMRVELFGCSAGHLCNRKLGMQNGRIPNRAITASSQLISRTAPYLARLNLKKMGGKYGAWIPKRRAYNEWLQIDTGRLSKIIRIATQGRQDARQWVTRYYLSSSVDGVHYTRYTHNSVDKLFYANRDSNTIKFHSLIPSIRGRFVRVYPWGWYSYIALRIELYGCKLEKCGVPVGLQDRRIPDSYLTSSSHWDANHSAKRARLNHRNVGGTGAWSSRYNNAKQWLQVKLRETTTITVIAIQGRYEANQWVKSFELGSSFDGKRFKKYALRGRTKRFTANYDRQTVVYNRLSPKMRARYIRIYPKTWHSHISMRFELYGCSPMMRVVCYKPMGVGNGQIPDSNMKASSQWNRKYAAQYGRIAPPERGKFTGTWIARHNNHNQWLEINLGRAVRVTKVATKGRYRVGQWVKSFYLQYSANGRAFKYIRDGKRVKLFKANTNYYSIVDNPVNPSLVARYVRFNPRSWHGHISMRVEVYGCYSNTPSVSRPTLRPGDSRRLRGIVEVISRCQFRIRNRKRRRVVSKVQFIVNKRVTRTIRVYGYHADLRENTYGFRAGTTVSCRVKSRFVGVKEWSSYDNSNRVFFGLKVHPKKIVVSEETPWKPVRITGVVPITCRGRRIGCSIIANIRSHDDYVTDKCQVKITERSRRRFILNVRAVKNFMKSGKKSMWLKFDAIKSRPGGSRFWVGYRIPFVKIYIPPVTKGGYRKCQATGDPHYRTFDGKYYDILRNPGTYIFVKSKKRHFEVQTRIWPCWRVVCNCGVAIRENDDVLTIDMCNGAWKRTVPRVIQKSKQPLGNRIRIQCFGSGQTTRYKVVLKSGVWLNVNANYWGLNVYITVPGSDYNSVVGLCGNNNGNNRDEFEGKGIYTFANKYKLKPGTSLFESLPPRIPKVTGPAPACRCVRHNGKRTNSCGIRPAPEIEKGGKTVTPIVVPPHPKKPRNRDNKDYDPGSINYVFKPPKTKFVVPTWPTKTGIKKGKAVKHCKKILSRIAKKCRRYINFKKRRCMKECVTDIKITGKLSMARSSLSSLMDECKDKMLRDPKNYKKNKKGKLVPNTKIINNFCPNQCSGRGRCVKNKCRCKGQWTAADCSISKTKPPKLDGIQSKGLCDVRSRVCHYDSVYGFGFYDFGRLQCHLKKFRLLGKTWRSASSYIKRRGHIQNFREVRCKIPIKIRKRKVRGLPIRFVIAVSNNGALTSNTRTLTIFDSACYLCQSNGRCHRKRNNCKIKGICYALNESNPKNKALKCIPVVSRYSWTRVGSTQRALGMKSGKIPNKSITASSSWDKYHAPWLARLKKSYRRPYANAWSAKVNNKNQWIQVYLSRPKKVKGIATQGRRDANQWVIAYFITYSMDGVHYIPYKCKKIFRANRNRNGVVKHKLKPAITASYVRVHPVSWASHISMRLELYGHKMAANRLPLGVQDKRIPHSAIQASSQWDTNHGPFRGRLFTCIERRLIGAWSSRYNNGKQWLQIDIGSNAKVAGVATQGRQGINQWVKSYSLGTSQRGIRFKTYTVRRRVKVFSGNRDQNTVVKHAIIPALRTRYVRFYPRTWFGHISMRVEVYGRRLGRRRPKVRPLGLQDKRIPNRAISASSKWDRHHASFLARLNLKRRGRYVGGWCARKNNKKQWIQVDLGKPKKIAKIATQGRQDARQFVSRYIVKTSIDGVFWVTYKKRSFPKVFIGNSDQYTIKENPFDPKITARYFRVYPLTWVGHISMRLELYGYPASRNNVPIGVEDGYVKCHQMTASSSWDKYHLACRGRLNTVKKGHYRGAWSPRARYKQWIQVRLSCPTRINKVLTQGRQDMNQWVTQYSLAYSLKGRKFLTYKVGGKKRVFRGNNDRNSIVSNPLNPAIFAKYIRVYPLKWVSHPSMRFDLYGKRPGYQVQRLKALGIENRRVPNRHLTASSSWDRNHGPSRGRLNIKRQGRRVGSWSAKRNNKYQWFQVYFPRPKTVTAIGTQGRQDYSQWVTRFYVMYSIDGVHFVPYKKYGVTKVFRGNKNRNSVVYNKFNPPIKANFIRVYPTSWKNHISMRIELYGFPASRSRLGLGVEDGRIPDGNLRASSMWNRGHGPQRVRLNIGRTRYGTGAWSSRHNNRLQYIQVDIGCQAKVVAIGTQGRQDYDQWVTSFKVSSSKDGIRYKFYPKVFRGNRNRHTIVMNRFGRSLNARYVRVHPYTWHSHISMRMELYGYRYGRRPVKAKPSGIQSGKIPKSSFSASSIYNKHSPAWLARLRKRPRGKYTGCWLPRHKNTRQWIQVDLKKFMRIIKVATQGRPNANQYVTRFVVGYSQDRIRWLKYTKKGRVKIFPGNKDPNTIKENIFSPAIRARYVRVYPKKWVNYIALRLEFYGVPIAINKVPIGVADGKIPNGYITASSIWDRNHAAWRARLYTIRRGRLIGGWSSKRNVRGQWLQFNFGKYTTLTTILTQGRQDMDQWVTTYSVAFSKDGHRFRIFKAFGRTKVFLGNSDRNTIVRHNLRPYVRCRYFRIYPRTWHKHMSMRVGFYGRRKGVVRPSLRALGLESGRVRNNQITASSDWNRYHGSFLARLNRKARGRYQGGWSARHNNVYQYLQVTFRRPKKVVAVATQGRQNANQWVTKYYITYSLDTLHYVPYRRRGAVKIFRGNKDRNTVVRHILRQSINARSIRIHPVSWRGHISMRVEFYGRNAVTRYLALGVEDGRIPDSSLSASSIWDINHRAANGRLNFVRQGRRTGGWSSRYNKYGQWFQVDIGSLAKVTGIATQGRQDYNQWVRKYRVRYSKGSRRFPFYGAGRSIFRFHGNSDRNSIVFHRLRKPFIARYVRFYPQSWHSHMSMRVELYGRRFVPSRLPTPCGISNKRLPNRYITASSEWNKYHAPWLARLRLQKRGRYMGGWSAKKNKLGEWIQFDLRRYKKVSKVATQGRSHANQFVRSYTVKYSLDGRRWVPYRVNSVVKVLPGNKDHNTIKENLFQPPIIARFVRIYPKTWHNHISLRAEFYAVNQRENKIPLGVEDRNIPSYAIRASSQWDRNHGPSRGRLNTIRQGRKVGAWCAKRNDRRQWIQVALGTQTTITAILTQGRHDYDQWVKTYTVGYSNKGRNFRTYRFRGRPMVFSGNSDRNTIVTRRLRPAIRARYIRIYPRTWHKHISMRIELHGRRARGIIKPPVPLRALGMQSGRIRNSQITASSIWDKNHGAFLGRLNRRARGRHQGGWSARNNNRNQYIQVNFRRPKTVKAIATQGRQNANQWVTSYYITYSLDELHYTPFVFHGRVKIFNANRDRNTVVLRRLQPAIGVVSIRIHPVSWRGHISMRLELYGRNAARYRLPLGTEDHRIPESAFSSSSNWDNNHRASNARLNFVRRRGRTGAWSSRYNKPGQWLQVDIGSLARVTGIATQGRQDYSQWVKSYYVTYNVNGRRFVRYKHGRRTVVFNGNRDRNSIVYNRFVRPLRARFVRVYPTSWHGHISMRMELYGRRFARRPRPVPSGISSGRLANRYITASSKWDRNHAPWFARLHRTRRGNQAGGWSARRNNRKQWIQFNFKKTKQIYKVVTQGRSDADQWVTSFVILYSQDGKWWATYKSKGRPKIFPGNSDRNSLMENVFSPSFTATYVRIRPWTWHRHISLRAEFYLVRGSIYKVPIGVEDGKIPDSAFSASSQWNRNHGPHLARLNNIKRGRNVGGWSAKKNDLRQWIQVDIGRSTIISKILIQGRQDRNQWVKTFTVSYSNNGKNFKKYRVRGRVWVFNGNSDRNIIVVRTLRPVIRARFVRIHPRTWHTHISLRFGLMGRRPTGVPIVRPTRRPTRGPVITKLKHCPVTLDLGFLIDGSSSVGRRNFHLVKLFLRKIASTFTITKHQTHVGLVTYSNKANVVMKFRQYNHPANVYRAITLAPYPNQRGERLDLGLETAYNAFFRKEPDYIQRTLVVVTSGRPDRRIFGRIHRITRIMERRKVKVFIIRLGSYRKGSLMGMSYEDRHVYYLPSYNQLLARAGHIAYAICKQQEKETDIYKFYKRMILQRPENYKKRPQKKENGTTQEY